MKQPVTSSDPAISYSNASSCAPGPTVGATIEKPRRHRMWSGYCVADPFSNTNLAHGATAGCANTADRRARNPREVGLVGSFAIRGEK
ncbi:hypothetical protein GCM10027068_10180 [Prescottella soli]